MKICSRCKQSKPLEEFHKLKREKDGLHFNCKQCSAVMSKGYRTKFKEKVLNDKKKYYSENKQHVIDKAKEYYNNNK